jgi:hypothetical protein
MSMQVLPTAPSPTVTHFMNLEALILHRPLLCSSFLLLPPTPSLVWFGWRKQEQEERWECLLRAREEGEAGKKGRGDREAGTNGGKSGRRGREGCGGRRKRSPRRNGRWVGTTPVLVLAGCPLVLPQPRNGERMDGWMEWVEQWRRWVERERDVPTVCARIISFSITLALLSLFPINPNLIPLLLRYLID